MRIEHGLVDARITAFGALERLRIEMITCVVFEMMFVLGDKRAVRTCQQLFSFDVLTRMFPEIRFGNGYKTAFWVFALVRL